MKKRLTKKKTIKTPTFLPIFQASKKSRDLHSKIKTNTKKKKTNQKN